MAYTTINKGSLNFNTKLYTGNGGTQNITGVGFKPDWVWVKSRSLTKNHKESDIVRGATKAIQPNGNDQEATDSNGITSFNSDGFSLGAGGDYNTNNATQVSWNWKAGTSVSGTTTGSGTGKSYSGSVNTTSGFSIIKYLGNGTAGHTIPHRLGEVPKMILVKSLDRATNWMVYHSYLGGTKFLKFNLTTASTTSNAIWYNTSPTSSVFTVGSDGDVNNNNENYISYIFTEKQGYSKFGSYTGNNNANGTFVYTGFKPSFVIIKCSDAGESYRNWSMFDNKRSSFNGQLSELKADTNAAQNTGEPGKIDLISNGFKLRGTSGETNDGGQTYIYMAFGQSIVGSNNIPATAR